jgi:hypothetical protein
LQDHAPYHAYEDYVWVFFEETGGAGAPTDIFIRIYKNKKGKGLTEKLGNKESNKEKKSNSKHYNVL